MQSVMHMHIFLLELLIVLWDKVWEEFQSVLLHNFDSWRFFLLTWHRSKMSLPFFLASLFRLFLHLLPSRDSLCLYRRNHWGEVYSFSRSLHHEKHYVVFALNQFRLQSCSSDWRTWILKLLPETGLPPSSSSSRQSSTWILVEKEGTGNECGFDSIHGKRDATAAFTRSFIEEQEEEEEEEDQEEPGVKSGKKRQVSCRTFTRSLCPKKSLEGGRDCAANFNKRDR